MNKKESVFPIGRVQVFNFSLNRSDYDDIDAVCTKSNNLFNIIGDCGDEYR